MVGTIQPKLTQPWSFRSSVMITSGPIGPLPYSCRIKKVTFMAFLPEHSVWPDSAKFRDFGNNFKIILRCFRRVYFILEETLNLFGPNFMQLGNISWGNSYLDKFIKTIWSHWLLSWNLGSLLLCQWCHYELKWKPMSKPKLIYSGIKQYYWM